MAHTRVRSGGSLKAWWGRASHKGRTFMNGADRFVRAHGHQINEVAMHAAPVVGALAGPTSGVAVAAMGKAASTYADVSRKIGGY